MATYSSVDVKAKRRDGTTRERSVDFRVDSSKQVVQIGRYEISMEEFCDIAEAVMTDGDLVHHDPRLDLHMRIMGMKLIPGYVGGASKLACG